MHIGKVYDKTVAELFSDQVLKTPNNIAVSYQDNSLTYQTLNEKTNQFTHWLDRRGVKSGGVVGVLLEPGIDFLICILAITKLGAVYLPLDASAPNRRLTEILSDASPVIVITNEQYIKQVNTYEGLTCLIKNIHLESTAYPRTDPILSIHSLAPIYIMYTSGSTGRPKGVIIPHQAVVNLVKVENFSKVNSNETVAQFSNLAFDASTFEVWSALLNGAMLKIVPADARTNPAKLKLFLDGSSIHYLFLPTSLFHQVIKSVPDTLDNVRFLIFGGEQVNATLLKNFITYRKTHGYPITLINGYGPTENTTFTTRQIINEDSRLDEDFLSSIGKPLLNVKTYILDENHNLADEGGLYISGANLALGYHNCPVENAQKFILNTFETKAPFERLYKTGDKVRRLSSGDLLCQGRLDDQVKVGGFRIHLNEIENILMKHPDVSLAAVTVELGGGSHQMLAAYIVLATKETPVCADELRKFLYEYFPAYMLPAKYLLVEELPLTPVGKIDKDKLDKIPHTDLSFHVDTSPLSKIEEKIKGIWCHLLNRKVIDAHTNFFELGANSLLITEACVLINTALQSKLQISNLLSHPTIHKLSRYLEGDRDVHYVKEPKTVLTDRVAIIGMSCRFPKANSLDQFWDNLCQGSEGLVRFNEDELADTVGNYTIRSQNYVPVRGILSNVEQFDAMFFGFSPTDASMTDPQHRVFLECAWEALEHASVAPSKVGSKAISVFAGMTDSTYLHENLKKSNWYNEEHDQFQERIATSVGMLSTQVSYRLNLRGRSLNVNTACSTGLVAVSQACQDLILGSCDVALAGAISIMAPQAKGYIYHPGSILSPDGHCRPFAEDANGTVFSNGVGIVVLKRLDDALEDNDTIYAVINGYGINNDGSDKVGYTAPSTSGQIACITEAITKACISAEDVGFVEAHGTATSLGDLIEIDALSTVFSKQTEKKQFCVLGSVKGNIGHTDVAAGIAGLIKTALCLYHQKIPPTLHFKKPNPNIDFAKSPFFVNTNLMEWEGGKGSVRYAGVSSFGVGGTNVHMILSEPPRKLPSSSSSSEKLLVLSAKTEHALEANTQKLIQHLSKQSNDTHDGYLSDVSYTLRTGREDFQWRRIGVGKNTVELIKSLVQNSINKCSNDEQLGVVFMFPGQGMQYYAMAHGLMKEVPYFSRLVEQGIQHAKSYLDCNLLEIINNPDDERLKQTEYAQPTIFIIEYALAQLLMGCGIKPTALIGHSLGELVAACLAGVFSFEDGISLVCQRGLLMEGAEKGSMLAIECNEDEFEIYQQQAEIELALHNSTRHCVASGSFAAIAKLEQYLIEQGIPCQKLNVSHAFHSRYMETLEKSFTELFSNIKLSSPRIPIVSNVTGTWLSTDEATRPTYWYRHLRHAVQLSKGLKTLLDDEHGAFIEVGPGRSLSIFLKEIVRYRKDNPLVIQTLPDHHRVVSDMEQLLSALGVLWRAGTKIQWSILYDGEKRNRVALPSYSFQRQRYWIEPDVNIRTEPTLYKQVWSHFEIEKQISSVRIDTLKEHTWIVFKDNIGLAEPVINFLQKNHIHPVVIEVGDNFSKIDSLHFIINPRNKDHYHAVLKDLSENNLRNTILLHFLSCFESFEHQLSKIDIEETLHLGFYSVLYFTQAYVENFGPNKRLRGVVITHGTQRIIGAEEIIPLNASLLGPCKVVPLEHPNVAFKLIDLDLQENRSRSHSLLELLLQVCTNQDWEQNAQVMAFRQGCKWEKEYTELRTKVVNHRLKENGVYLITGGLGSIALKICETIAKEVSKPTFILLSRNKFPEEIEWQSIVDDPNHKFFNKVYMLKNLQDAGARLHIYETDISDYNSLLSTIEESQSSFGKMNGVVHCAGLAGGGVMQLKTHEMAEKVMSPKIVGTYNLSRALTNTSLDFVVLMSSIAVLTGEVGQIDYCGANAALDAFAVSSLFDAQYVVSINWNTWRDIGMAVETDKPEDVTFFDRGNDISPAEGQALFLEIMKNPYANVTVSNYDLTLYEKNYEKKQNIKVKAPAEIVKTNRDQLGITPHFVEPKSPVEKRLAVLWEKTLGIEPIGIQDDFFDLGGHSLKALSLVEKINQIFQCELTIQHLYQSPSIASLSQAIALESKSKLEILVPLHVSVEKAPRLFLCHPLSGLISCFDTFVAQSSESFTMYGLQDPSAESGELRYKSLSEMAHAYLSAIKKIQTNGPYFLVGYSFGGNLVYEMGAILQKQKEELGLLALIDSWSIFTKEQQGKEYFEKIFKKSNAVLPSQMTELAWSRMKLLLAHKPSKNHQDMLLFKANKLSDGYKEIEHPMNGWSNYNSGAIHWFSINGDHETVMSDENSRRILEILRGYLFS